MHAGNRSATLCVIGSCSCSWRSVGRCSDEAAASRPRPRRVVAAATPEENLAVVRSFYEEGVNGADLSVFDRVAAPDIVYHGATVGDEEPAWRP